MAQKKIKAKTNQKLTCNLGTENSGIRCRIMEYGKEIMMMPSWQIVVIQLSGALSQASNSDAVLNIWPTTGAKPPGCVAVGKEQEAQGGGAETPVLPPAPTITNFCDSFGGP